MQLQTILRRIEPHKGFVYDRVTFSANDPISIEVQVRPRARSRGICSGCGRKAAGYDRTPPRRFAYVPLWGISVWLVYSLRRVSCPACGVRVERVPWAEGKSPLTTSFEWFLARWAKRLSWRETAQAFGVTWEAVYRSVERAVNWGLAHRDLNSIESIGVDEIQWRRGHKYLTLVYQIDSGNRRLLWIGKDRTAKTLLRFFRMLGKSRTARLKYVCSDMWKPYLKVIARKAGQALNILDRYHVTSHLNKAIDDVRAEESKRLVADGYEPLLKHSRWCLLKRPENLTTKQSVRLAELLKYNLRTVRSYLLKEEFQRFWEYRSMPWAARFLAEWHEKAMRSRIEPMKKAANTVWNHGELILNWFLAKGTISAGMVEGFNNKVKLTMRKAYGYRTEKAIETALYHALGKLPEPESTHRFC
jgi:transposase